MISKIVGVIDSKYKGFVVVMTASGVGYQVFCSDKTMMCLSAGQSVKMAIETNVREDHIHLYGFLSDEERAWFNLLTTVQGVGAKAGLAILSVASTSDLFNSIVSGDKSVVGQASGIGPKIATRIVSELKDKLGKVAEFMSVDNAEINVKNSAVEDFKLEITEIKQESKNKIVNNGQNSFKMREDAVSALVNLGYKQMIAYQAIGEAVKEIEELEKEIELNEVIRISLKKISGNL